MQELAKPYSLETNYLSRKRLASYSHQLSSVIELRPKNVLEVGKGPGLVSGALQAVGIKVVTLDPRAELQPDLLGSVLEIPAEAKGFEVTLCCQVLEHLPFHDFQPALKELRRVTVRALVLSLPDITRHYFVQWRLPILKEAAWSCSLARRTRKGGPRTKGHHWEIGYPGTSLFEVQEAMRASGWAIEQTWRVPEHSWHRFFLLKPQASPGAASGS